MYGVVMRDPTGGLAPYMEKLLPKKIYDELYVHWIAAANGEFGSHEFFRRIGFTDIPEAERAYLDTIEIDEGFVPAAERLRAKGKRIGLLSNDLGEWSAWLRRKYDLDRLFDAVAVSGDEGVSKPDTRIFQIMSERLEVVPEQCVYIDDRVRFLDAAAKFGMKTLLFDPSGASKDACAVRDFGELMNRLEKEF